MPRLAYFSAVLLLFSVSAFAQTVPVAPWPGVTVPIFGIASAVDGGGSFTPQLFGPQSCTVPAYSFTGATTNGYGASGGTTLCAVVGGTQRLGITSSAVTSTVPVLGPDGTSSAPTYSFSSDATMGIYRPSSKTIAFANNGTQEVTFDMVNNTFNLSEDSYVFRMGGSADVILAREGANRPIYRNSTAAQRFDVANTYTSASNNSLFSVDWQTVANVATVGTRTAATGVRYPLRLVSQSTNAADAYATLQIQLTSLPIIRGGYFNSALSNISDATAGTWFSFGEFTSTATSGSVVNTAILPTYNQSSGTAANTDLLINRTQTAVGSGAQYLIDAQVGGTSKFHITADGTSKGTQEVFLQSTVPTCTSANNCGTGNGTFATGSSDTAGSVTLGTTPASGFVITFNGTWAAAPVCTVWMNKAGMAAGKAPLTSVTSTTTITVVTNGTAPSTGDIYAYRCTGLQ